MAGMRSSSACRRQFKRLDILPILCQYIFSLMVPVLDNLEIIKPIFQTNSTVRGMNTRNQI